MKKNIDLFIREIVFLNETKRNETKRNTMQKWRWNNTYVLTSMEREVEDI